MIDSHCHLDYPIYDEDRDEVIQEALQAGVKGFLIAGVSMKGWKAQEKLEKRYSCIKISYGIHPWEVSSLNKKVLDYSIN